MNPRGETKGCGVHGVGDALVGAQGVWWEEDAAGHAVQDRQPEGVKGSEAKGWGSRTADCGLVHIAQRGEGLVGGAVQR